MDDAQLKAINLWSWNEIKSGSRDVGKKLKTDDLWV